MYELNEQSTKDAGDTLGKIFIKFFYGFLVNE